MTCCPCCFGFTLQAASKIIAILDMVGALFGSMTSGVLLVTIIFYRDQLLTELYNDARLGRNYELRSFLKKPAEVQYSFLGFTILICMLELIVAMILLKGARKRSITRCTLWFRVHCLLFLIGVLFVALAIFAARERIVISVAGTVGLAYQAYTLWVVHAFVQQIKVRRIARRQYRESKRRELMDTEEDAEPLQDLELATTEIEGEKNKEGRVL